MEIGSRSAQRLYDQALDIAQPAAAPTPAAPAGPKPAADFGLSFDAADAPSASDTLGALASDAIETVRAGEAAAVEMMAGRADPHSVVEALAATEMALEMAVTVRDKVVEAYQEILRMPV